MCTNFTTYAGEICAKLRTRNLKTWMYQIGPAHRCQEQDFRHTEVLWYQGMGCKKHVTFKKVSFEAFEVSRGSFDANHILWDLKLKLETTWLSLGKDCVRTCKTTEDGCFIPAVHKCPWTRHWTQSRSQWTDEHLYSSATTTAAYECPLNLYLSHQMYLVVCELIFCN